MRTTALLPCALAVATLTLVACGSETDEPGVQVVATTGIVADVVAEVAGPGVEVRQLVPDGASPHDFQLSAQDRQRLAEADLVAANGGNLEPGIPLEEASTLWELAANVPDPLPFAGGGSDPHVWMDPTRVAGALPSLARALAAADPGHARGYRERAADYGRELASLDRRLARAVRRVPPEARQLVTSHDSLGYFADRYGFDVAAAAFPASGAEAEPSAATLDELSATVTALDVPAVFAGEEDDPEVLRQLADEAGVEVVDDLLIESPGSAGTLDAMLEHDAARIAAALRGP
jgi:ABC-type Zn uptake system ZnuABC Zn-binding protein ZnuA